MPSAFNIIRSFTKLPHSLRFASFGVATAALRLRPGGFVKLALCLAPLRNCEKRHSARLVRRVVVSAPGRDSKSHKRASRAPRFAVSQRKGKASRQICTPGAACTASAPRRENKSQVKATPQAANIMPPATAWHVYSRARARTPAQGGWQGQNHSQRARGRVPPARQGARQNQ